MIYDMSILKQIFRFWSFLTTINHSTGHGVVQILWFFIFSESVSQGRSNDMRHVNFQANPFFTMWLTTWLHIRTWSKICSNERS